MKSDLGGELTRQVIGAAIDVHRELGPDLLESVYAACLARELEQRDIAFAHEVKLPMIYKGMALNCEYRMDFVVAEQLVVELQAVDQIILLHEDADLSAVERLSAWSARQLQRRTAEGWGTPFRNVLCASALRLPSPCAS